VNLIPSRVYFTTFLDCPTCRSEPTFNEVSCPLTASSNEPPWFGAWLSRLLRVSLSGFLNPSAISKQVRVLELYFTPQPFVNFPSRAFPSQGSCSPLEVTNSLAVIHRVCRNASLVALLPWISPTPTFSAVAWIPTKTMGPLFTKPKLRFPVALDH
jgi:hypothetical protein